MLLPNYRETYIEAFLWEILFINEVLVSKNLNPDF